MIGDNSKHIFDLSEDLRLDLRKFFFHFFDHLLMVFRGLFDALIDTWSRQLWDLFWATRAGEGRVAQGGVRGRPPSLVAHHTAVQDHLDGGVRALYVPTFAESLRVTWFRRLMDPAPRVWKGLVWAYVVEAYGHLQQGPRLLCSSVDFTRLPGHMPSFFR